MKTARIAPFDTGRMELNGNKTFNLKIPLHIRDNYDRPLHTPRDGSDMV
jgi:hypothetical protein